MLYYSENYLINIYYRKINKNVILHKGALLVNIVKTLKRNILKSNTQAPPMPSLPTTRF